MMIYGRGVSGYDHGMEWRCRVRSGEIGREVDELVHVADLVMDHVGMEQYGPSWWTTDRAVGLTVSTDVPETREALEWSESVAVTFEAALARAGHPVGVGHLELERADGDD